MAKTLSTYAKNAINGAVVDVVRLMEIDLSGLTLYLCARAFDWGEGFCTIAGQVYEPAALQIG